MNFQDVKNIALKEFNNHSDNGRSADWNLLKSYLFQVTIGAYTFKRSFSVSQGTYIIDLAKKKIQYKDTEYDFYILIDKVEELCEMFKDFPK